jgi:hypothetical protein
MLTEAGKQYRRHVLCVMAVTGVTGFPEAIFIVCCYDNRSVWEELQPLRRRM